MISSIGILLTWVGSLNLIILFFSNNKKIFQSLVRINLLIHFMLFCLLEIGLFLDDFSIFYIANHSAATTPPIYKFASLWGSLDGSILLWNFVLSIYFYLYIKFYKSTTEIYDIKIFALIILFFNGFTIFSSSPFAGCIQLVRDLRYHYLSSPLAEAQAQVLLQYLLPPPVFQPLLRSEFPLQPPSFQSRLLLL